MSAATAAKIPLAISFSGLLQQMAKNVVLPEDLGGAIFYFGCTREHAMRRSSVERHLGYWEELTYERRTELHQQLCELIRQAEAEKRIAWRKGSQSSWEELNALLQSRNLPPIDPTSTLYSYPGVAEAVEDQQLPYDIVHHC